MNEAKHFVTMGLAVCVTVCLVISGVIALGVNYDISPEFRNLLIITVLYALIGVIANAKVLCLINKSNKTDEPKKEDKKSEEVQK